MDTLICSRKNKKIISPWVFYVSTIVGICVISAIFNSVPIFAQENLRIANNAIISPFDSVKLEKGIINQLSYDEKVRDFNESVQRRYRGAAIQTIDTGVKHIRILKYYNGKPVKINVVEINRELNSNLELTPALATSGLSGKSKISSIASRNKSIVAINGTYFKPQTGVPLGTLMINGKMLTGPIYDRVAMGIFDTHYDMARVQLNATLKTRRETIKIDNINQPRMLSTYVLAYSDEWGVKAPSSPKYGKQVVIKDSKIINISTDAQAIPKGGYVIVGPASKMQNLKVGDGVKLNFETIPDWKSVKHIISGGPYLLKRGQVYVDIKEEKLLPIGGRNPRTAIGYTAENNLIIVSVDGREETSVGVTLTELAYFMKSIGCHEAMNLDGGGSTVMYINGKVVNSPAVKGGIALSNALTLNRIN